MLPELIGTKYISEKKPDIIYTSLDGSVNFSFNLLVTCKYNDMDEWKRAALEIIKSIKLE